MPHPATIHMGNTMASTIGNTQLVPAIIECSGIPPESLGSLACSLAVPDMRYP